jgi:alpha-mannosidase
MNSVVKEAACFNNPLIWASTSKKPSPKGSRGDAALIDPRFLNQPIIQVNNAPSLILDSIKAAQDATSGDIVIRLYESIGARGTGEIKIHQLIQNNIKRVFICNGLEEESTELGYDNGTFKVSFKPFEILSLRLKLK